MVILLIQVLGLLILIASIISVRFLWRFRAKPGRPPLWKPLRAVAFLLGVSLALLTLVFPTLFSYPYATEEGTGRVVGIPFLVAYFDHQGYDYSGFLTLPAAIMNALLWFLLPWVVLAAYRKRWRARSVA